MLSRGLFDAMVFWPTVAWPLIFSSILLAIVQVCRLAASDYGVSPLDGSRQPDALILYLFFPAAAVFEVAVHGFMLWVVGWEYLIIALPIYVFGMILLPGVLDSFRPAQYVLPILYIGFAASFIVLIGVMDVGFLRYLNTELYSLLSGYPTKL